MAFVVNDRVQQTTTTTGTGTITFDASVPSGFQGFVAGIGSGNITNYCISDGVNWETGIGTVTAGGADTLSRTVLQSSNADALVNFPAGVKTVICVISADKSLYKNDAGTIQGVPAGSFTPTLGGSTGDGGAHTYSVQEGVYQRIGAWVIFNLRMAVTTIHASPPTGNVAIRGLPFVADRYAPCSAFPSKVTSPANAQQLNWYANVSTSALAAEWQLATGEASSNLLCTQIANGFNLFAGGVYRTAAA